MLLEKLDRLERKNERKIVVGYHLGDNMSQVSYCRLRDEHPETVSIVAGEEQYNIPTVLCKREGVNQWFYGRDAVKVSAEHRGILVDKLLTLARLGEPVTVERELFDPQDLLVLYIKRCLSVLNTVESAKNIAAVMISVDLPDGETVDMMQRVAEALTPDIGLVYFQGYEESLFQYVIHQPAEVWTGQVAACDFSGEYMRTYYLELNRRTRPVAGFVEKMDFPGVRAEIEDSRLDGLFLDALQEICAGRKLSAFYLLGERFSEEWSKESLRFLCKGRRAFQGNNLYSKGACYAMKETILEDSSERNYIFLGKSKLKCNIGMRMTNKGKDVYVPLLDAGVNWFDAANQVDFILETGNTIAILLTPLNGNEPKIAEITLPELPERPRKMTRIRMTVSLKQENRMHIHVQDMGFGEMFPASKLEWEEECELV